MDLFPLGIRKTHTQAIYMHIPYSPNSLSSHTDDVVLEPAGREGKGGNFGPAGTGGGRFTGRTPLMDVCNGTGVATRGNSTISTVVRMIGVEAAR
jgi:hypothetical protein